VIIVGEFSRQKVAKLKVLRWDWNTCRFIEIWQPKARLWTVCLTTWCSHLVYWKAGNEVVEMAGFDGQQRLIL